MRVTSLAGLIVLGVFVAACGDVSNSPQAPTLPEMNISGAQAQQRYIVRFRDGERDVPGERDRLVRAHRGRVTHTYQAALKGFAAEFSDQEVAALSRDPRVLSVERDQIARAIGTQPNPPSWGLDRIDQAALPLNSSYTYGSTGAGVTVYILDTGIRFSHNEFGGRAVKGIDQITSGGTAADCHGHGTHVAGTVGGSTYGVAKSVALVAVRVLDCNGNGSYSQVIAGVDWVTQQKLAQPAAKMVANMSLGGPFSSALNNAVANSISAGVTYALAAGNDAVDACTASPASTPSAITVAATTINDGRASYSNYGTCVDLFAPGSSITSAWWTGNSATNTISGTSMASPHVAGVAALYLEVAAVGTPSGVASALVNNATAGVVTNPGTGSPNRLLNTSFIGGGGPPAPVASFTSSCSGLSCTFDGSGSTAQSNATYAWSWGDGTANGTGTTPAHGYAAAGTYTVTLTITDAGGSNSASQSVVVTSGIPAPVVDIASSCSGLTCTFDGSGSTAQPNASYLWAWGEGQTTPGIIVTRTFPAPGTYAARLTITDAGGTAKKVIRVTVTNASPPAPVASFTFSCTGLSCSFDGSGSTADPSAAYTWAWGDGTANGAGKTANHTYAAGGTFSVTLTVSDPGGSDGQTQSVSVTAPLPQPVASFTFSCTVLSCTFDGNSSTAQPNATYSWAWGDGTANGSGKTPSHSYTAPGTYTVTLTVVDGGGQNSTSRSVTVTVPAPVVVIATSCVNLTCTFDGSGSTAQPNATYTWGWGEGQFTPGVIVTRTFPAPGTYAARLTITDAGGTSKKVIRVTVP